MKGFLKLLIAFVIGAAIGWALGYLRFPSVEQNNPFWLGFAACLALIAFVIALLFVTNRQVAMRRVLGLQPTAQPPRSRTMASVWMVVSLSVMLTGAFVVGLVYQQGKWARADAEARDLRLRQQAEWTAAMQQGQQGDLLADLLRKIDAELAQNASGGLSKPLIARVIALNHGLKPYRSIVDHRLSDRKRSPERGQLLLALCAMPLDTAAWQQIKHDAPFWGADLRGADLRGANLSGADLSGADLRDADLRGANLAGANFSWADLWGSKLDSADLHGANLRRTNLCWAALNAANLKTANLSGADLRNAKFRQADLQGALLQFARAEGAQFLGAVLVRVDLVGTHLQKVNFTDADMTAANLMATDMTDARLTRTQLDSVACGKDLLDKLAEWHIAEAAAIQKTFKVVDDTVRHYVTSVHRLERIAQ